MYRTTWIGVMAIGLTACAIETELPYDHDDRPLPCAAFALDYDATYHLDLPEGARIRDGAIGAGTIGVLADIDGTPWLVRFDAQTRDRIDALAIPRDDCEVQSITHADAAWLGLYVCSDQLEVRTLDRDLDLVTQLTSPGKGDAYVERFIAHDGDRLWLYELGALYRITPDNAAVEEVPFEPLTWGPTSGFDHEGWMHVFARDAFEGGMRNYLGVEDADTQERCLFDVEDTPGLELQPSMRTFVDDARVYALSPNGNLAEHLLTDLR